MKMNKNVKRYTFIIVLSVIMNFVFYNIAHYFHLPAWLDCIGTSYAAFVLEPAAGLLVAFVSNFYEAAFIYDSSSLIYYATSATVAIGVGICMRKQGEICWKRLGLMFIVVFVSGAVVSSLITIWRTGGIPDSAWERHFYEMAMGVTHSHVLSCFFGTAVLKFVDVAVITVLLPVFYLLTPHSLININNQDIVSWKNPYFEKKEQDPS